MKRKGISPYISTTLVILIGIVAIYLVLRVISPTIDKAKDSAIVTEALQNMRLIDNYIKQVVSEGEDSKRTVPLKVTEGTYLVDPDCNCINFSYTIKSELDIGGTKDNINISRNMDNLNLFIIYDRVQIQNKDRFSRGENSVVIRNDGINTSTNYSIVYVGNLD